MKSILFLFLLLISVCNTQTKYDDFDALIKDAKALKRDDNHKLAIEKYKEALSILTPNSSTSFFDLAS